MKLFTISKRSQAMTAIYQVIAHDEEQARAKLRQDGHTHAENTMVYEVETFFDLSDIYTDESIPFSLEVEHGDYEG